MIDPLYENAKLLTKTLGRFRVDTLQRAYLIGYNRAFRLIGNLEEDGFVISVPDESGGYYQARPATPKGGA